MTRHGADVDRTAEWDEMRARHLTPSVSRAPSAARGVHHIALPRSDVEATIAFYQGVLEFPLTELFENRDYQGSTHFFFDIGNGNLSPSSTSPVSISVPTPRCSEACTTSRCRWSPNAGCSCRPSWPLQVCRTRS